MFKAKYFSSVNSLYLPAREKAIGPRTARSARPELAIPLYRKIPSNDSSRISENRIQTGAERLYEGRLPFSRAGK